jgi:hypothetical protein
MRGSPYSPFARLYFALVLEAIEARQKTMAFSDASPMLLKMHRAMHERYRANIIKPCPPELFFRPARREIPYFDSDYLLKPGIVAAIHGIYEAIADRAA